MNFCPTTAERRLLGWRLFTELSPKTRWVICVCCCLPLVAATSPSLALSRQGLSRPGEQRKQGQTAIDAAETVRIFPSSIITKIIIAKLSSEFALLSRFLCSLDTIFGVCKNHRFLLLLWNVYILWPTAIHIRVLLWFWSYTLENSLKFCATRFYWGVWWRILVENGSKMSHLEWFSFTCKNDKLG